MHDILPEGLENIGKIMSNFNHEIEDGAEDRLKTGKFYGGYTAWNFFAEVWWNGNKFKAN